MNKRPKRGHEASPKRIRIVRQSIVKVGKLLSGMSIDIRQSGSRAFVMYDDDGLKPKFVNIPVIPDGSTMEFLDAIQGFLDHEIGHVLFSDGKTIAEANSKSKRTGFFTNAIEDTFIERKMSARFTGCEYNLSNTRVLFSGEHIDPLFQDFQKDPTKTVADYWNLLSVCAIRAWAGQPELKRYMEGKWPLIEEITDAVDHLIPELMEIQNSWDSLDLAERMERAIYGDPDDNDEGGEGGDEEGDGDGDGESSGKGKKSKGKGKSKSKSSKSDDEGEDEGEDEGKSGDDDEDEDEGDSSESGDKDEGDDTAGGGDDDDAPSAENRKKDGGHLHEEDIAKGAPLTDDDFDGTVDYDSLIEKHISDMAIDSHDAADYVPFSVDYDVIEIFKPKLQDAEMMDRMHEEVADMVGPMSKKLQRVFVAANKSSWRSGLTEGRINQTSLARLIADDDRVFRKRRIRKTKDVAVSLLIDCSGSMAGGEFHTAALTALALGECLQKLRLASEIIGFTTGHGHAELQDMWRKEKNQKFFSRISPIYMPIFKAFDEQFGLIQKNRLARYQEDGRLYTNVDGESLRIAADRLLRRREPGKAIIVLSDGLPSGGYGDRRLNAHLKQTALDLEKEGVNVIGIGIMTDAPARFYRKHVLLDNIEALPGQVIDELTKVILQK